MRPPRVAFFTDSFHEVNGVAHTSRNFVSYAERHHLPFLSIRAGSAPALTSNALQTLELPRSRASIALEKDLHFDPLFPRHLRRIDRALRAFQPDLIHITGPSELGIFGAWFAWRHHLPLAASWHTNVHEYAARRTHWLTRFLPRARAQQLEALIERLTFDATTRFYRLARVLFAPNPELCNLLANKCHRPVHLMQRGVDTTLFSPTHRTRPRLSTASPPLFPQPEQDRLADTPQSSSSRPEQDSLTAPQTPSSSRPEQGSLTDTPQSSSSRPEQDSLTVLRSGETPVFRQSSTEPKPQSTPQNPTLLALRQLPATTLVLGFVGRLSIEKNVALLPRIQAQLRAEGITNTRFLIVGHGSLESDLRRDLPDALFPGVLRGHDLAEAYANMDLLVFPSHTDTFGNVVLEALASGVPALVTPSGGPRHIVHDPAHLTIRNKSSYSTLNSAATPQPIPIDSAPQTSAGSPAPPHPFSESNRTGYILSDDQFAPTLARLAHTPASITPMATAARAHALTCSWNAVFDKVYAAYTPLLPRG